MRAILVLALVLPAVAQQRPARDYPVRPVPFTAVHVSDAFWAPKIETNRRVSIPFAFQKDEETGRIDNFERAAKALRGEIFENHKYPPYPFDDTDVYKVIEGAAYALSVHPDPKLEAYVDGLIAKIGAAQEPDGYLYTARTIDPAHPHPWSGNERWVLEGVNSHELYNLGHLYEAAVAYYAATGKKSLLDIALRTADLLDKTFGPGKREIWPGHQIIEMGLAKLYRATSDTRYLDLARFMLDSRGPQSSERGAGNRYVEAHQRVTEQTEAVAGGHAVRAMYMYSGMADVAALTGDAAYVNALDRIWESVSYRKLHVTGGVGARAAGESFGEDYELPNRSAYNETCAAVGNDYWNHRMFLLHADARYIEVMERTLYNGAISGVSLDGKTFFYQNPLEATGTAAKDQRSPWFGVACCPGNITRFMASVPGYVYGQRGDAVWVNLFMASSADIRLDSGRRLNLIQETRYPWDGAVKITVNPDAPADETIYVRIPGWARNEPVPGNLYRFADTDAPAPALKVNGKSVVAPPEKGYAAIKRTWRKGDAIELNLPMPIRRVVANERVIADTGRVAIQRGPVVYAAEWADNPHGKVRNLMLPDTAKLRAVFRPALLNGVTVVQGRAVALSKDAQGKVNRAEQEFTAIPYYAWANRGRGEMMVWLPNSAESARPAPYPTITSTAKVSTSRPPHGGPATAVQDDDEPTAADPGSHFDWWNTRGAIEWVEYAFDKPQTLSHTEVFWYDDSGTGGGCAVPASWRLLYKDGEEWKPVVNAEPYGIVKDVYNQVSFQPITTSAVRLEVRIPEAISTGIRKWRVN